MSSGYSVCIGGIEMELDSTVITIGGDMFSEKIKKAQEFFLSENWRDFKKIFEEDKRDLLMDFDLFGNTAIHVATRSNNPKLLRDLLEMVPAVDRWNALRKKNFEGNSLLHEIALQHAVGMVDIVLELEKNVEAPPPPEEGEEEERRQPLLEMKNNESETPLFRAVKSDKLKMVKKMAQHVVAGGGDIKAHLHKERLNALHVSIYGQSFDIALWIMKQRDGSALALETNANGLTCLQLLSRMPNGLTCLQLLSRMPNAFLSYHRKNSQIVLPENGYYESQGRDTSDLCQQHTDLERGQKDDAKKLTSVLSRIHYGFWKCVATVSEGINDLLEEKKKHKLAERLAELLVKIDYTWQSRNDANQITIKLPPVLYNVPEKRKRLERKDKYKLEMEIKAEEENKRQYLHQPKGPQNIGEEKIDEYKYFSYTPLLVAASYGIIEIIKIFLKEHPQSINHLSDDKQNVLHMAVKHRKMEIFEHLKKHNHLEFQALASQISKKDNRTILHQVAIIDFYRAPDVPGAAFQLQKELEWFKKVEEVTPRQLIMHCDKENLTAGDLLDISHDDMLRDAQSWIKVTAQSCATVSILVATVVFAAAYTIPGGTEAGAPVLLRSSVFLFFTTMDIVALALSLASVMMFLSILTSPFELWDFHKALPIKLKVGFVFLFCSLITTMLAFIATILLTIRLQWKEWTSTLVYAAAFFPVSIFALILFPIYMKLPRLLTVMFKNFLKKPPIYRVINHFKKFDRKYP